jgi:hypothetical protein
MSSPTERRRSRERAKRRRAPSVVFGFSGVLTVATLTATPGCSERGEWLLATIQAEAGPREAGAEADVVCTPDATTVDDMGIDLYFLLEHSNEMSLEEWTRTVATLNGLFGPNTSDYASMRGIGAGFSLYPVTAAPPGCDEQCGTPANCNCLARCGCEDVRYEDQGSCFCNDTTCDAQAYAVPDFEITRLSEQQHAVALIGLSLRRLADPAIRPAVEGSLAHRNAWEKMPANEGRRITQVLVVHNSSEADCDHSLGDAERALAGPNKPRTYVVAVNDYDRTFDRLAVAGGTSEPVSFFTRPNQPNFNPFIEVAKRARLADGRCEYLVPEGTTNLDRVNLASVDGAIIPRVENRAACGVAGDGWFYDPKEPGRLMACENTCKTVLRPPQTGSATLQLGCPTVMAGNSRR